MVTLEYSDEIETYFDIASALGLIMEEGCGFDRRSLPSLAVEWANEFNLIYTKERVEGWANSNYCEILYSFTLDKFNNCYNKVY